MSDNKIFASLSTSEVDAFGIPLSGTTKAVQQPEPIDGGFWEDLLTSWNIGWSTAGSVDEAFDIYRKGSSISDEELQRYINAVNNMNKYGPTNEQFLYQKAVEENGGGFFGGMKALAENPGYAPQAIVTSLSTMVGSFFDSDDVAAVTLASMGTGAALGATGFSAGPLGTATTAGGALIAGFSSLTGAMETGLTLTELLKDELGGKEFNKENIREILNNEETVTRIKNRSLARGLTIAAVEGITAGLSRGVAGKLLKTPKTKIQKVVGIPLAVAPIEMIGGSLGELGGQIAAGQEIKGEEIFLEGILEAKGVVNVADIISAAATPSEYTINNGIATEKDVINFLNDKNLTDEEVSNIRINIVGNKSLEAKVKNKQRRANIGKNIDKTITDSKDREKLIDLEIERLILEQNNNKKGVFRKVNNDAKLTENQKKINDIIDKYEGIDVVELQKQTKKSVEQFNISESIAFAETEGKRIGKDVIVVDNDNKAQEAYDKIIAEKGGKAKNVKGADGFIIGDSIVINKDIAGKTGQINVGGHELLHGILSKHLNNLDTNAKKKLINDFKNTISKKSRNYIEAEINRRNKAGESLDINTTDEWLAIYSDGLTKGDLTFNEGIFTQLRNILHNVFRAFGYNKEFESGIATYNFMKDYQKSIQAGKLSQRAVDVAEGEVTSEEVTTAEAKMSRSKAVAAVNKMEKGAKTQAEFRAKEKVVGADGKSKILPSPFDNVFNSIIKEDGAINNYVKSLGLSKEKFQETIEAVYDRLINYDPAAKRKTDSGEPITVGEFLMANIGFGKLVAAKKLAIEAKREGKTTRIDAAKKTKEGETTFDIEDTDVTEQQKAEEQDISPQAEAKRKAEAAKKAKPTKSQLRKEMGIEDGSDTYNAVLDTARKVLIRAYNAGKTARQIQRDLTKEASTYLFKQVKNMLGTKAKYIPTIKKLRVPLVNSMFTADLVQMERNVPENERVFTKFVRELQTKEEVKNAVDQNLLPESALNIIDKGQSVNLYEKVMQIDFIKDKEGNIDESIKENKIAQKQENDFIKFFDQPLINPETGARSGLRGTRKDQLAKYASASLNFDATMQVAQEPEVAEKRQQIAELRGETIDNTDIQVLSANINRNPTLKFSRSSNKPVVNKNIGYHLETIFRFEGINKTKITQQDIEKYSENLTYKVPGQGVTIGESMSNKDKKAFANYALGVLRSNEYATVIDTDLKNELLNNYKKAVEDGKTVNNGILNEQKTVNTQSKNTPNSKVIKGSGDLYLELLNTIFGFEVKLADAQWVSRTFNFINGKFVSTTKNTTTDEKGNNYNDIIADLLNDKLFVEINSFLQSEGVDPITNPNKITEQQRETLEPFKKAFFTSTTVNPQYALNDYVNNKYTGNNAQSGLIIEGAVHLMETDSKSYENAKIYAQKFFERTGKKINNLELVDGVTGIDVHVSLQFTAEGINFRARPKLKADQYKKSEVNIYKNNQDSKDLGKALFEAAKEIQNAKLSKSVQNARTPIRYSKSTRGMSTFDFDETLIDKGKNFIIAKKGDETIKITSSEWPIQGPNLAEQGYTFDFKDFVNVRGGIEGPLLQKLKNRIDKFGPENNYILTARPAESATAIHGWLKSKGINIPLKNITGLGNSTAEAKALWMLDKFAEGYNDMYFVDDALPNVKAVKDLLSQLDVKSNVQQAKVKFSKSLNKDFNNILERVTGIESQKVFSAAQAKLRGSKFKLRGLIPPSAQDFLGLIYNFLPKGKEGDKAMNFFKKALIDPFARGINELNVARQQATDKYSKLLKSFPEVRKQLKKKLKKFKDTADHVQDYTVDQAIRVYLWNKAGFEVPGLSKRDLKALVEFVENDTKLQSFADEVGRISGKEQGYAKPGEYWLVENIKSDLFSDGAIGDVRSEFLAEWKENVNEIFSEKNLNKIQAIYGDKFVEALKDILYRMETGKNRPTGSNRLTNMYMNWVNNSVGAIMFFNIRSAVLQTISSINYINWTDNNPLKAGLALANQKQFWKDFVYLFNSDFLKQRRTGNRRGVNESELMNAVIGSDNPIKAALAWLLNKGFLPTQIADSFAIASGGATFYRNRVKTYIKQGLSQQEAEAKAFLDFQETTEVAQQSARPDLISQQQANPLGRLILAFQNTPMQYGRIMNKAIRDLVNRRGDTKTHISKIVYYGAVQAIIFNALQSAIWAALKDEDEEEFDKKEKRIVNGMMDGWLAAFGYGGKAFGAVKNAIMEYYKQEEKDWGADHMYTMMQLLGFSPPIGSKLRKIYSAIQTEKFNKGVSEKRGFTLDNPMWSLYGNLIEGVTNIPLGRLSQKMLNLDNAMDSHNEWWQRVALVMGWNTWDLGVKDKDIQKVKEEIKEERKIEKKKEDDIKREEKKKETEKENLEKEKENKKKSKKDGICSAISGSGNRCKKEVEPGSSYCTIHAKVEKRKDGKKKQCKKIKSNKERCKMQTNSKSGYCYYHD